MKNLIISGLFLVLLFSCKSAKELAQDGKYDKAFNKVVGDLKKKPYDTESLQILKLSFDNANSADLNRINQLSLKNAPDRWDEVAKIYQSLQNRHEKMQQTLPFLDASVRSEIRTFDYTSQIVNAQRNAADYKYSKGISLLDMNNKLKAREAVNYLKQARKYDPDYPDIDALIDEAYFKGTNHVLFLVNDYTNFRLPQDFLVNITQAGNNPSLNSTWVKYYVVPQRNFNYDYIVQFNLNYVRTIPERVNTKSDVFTRTIDDGWEYEYDRRGNVMKDANGNDIKRKKIRTVKCELIETTQTKSIVLESSLDYIDAKSNRVLKRIPVVLEKPFVYHYVTYKGDRAALEGNVSPDIFRNNRPVPFPSNIEMILMSEERLFQMVSAALMDNNGGMY